MHSVCEYGLCEYEWKVRPRPNKCCQHFSGTSKWQLTELFLYKHKVTAHVHTYISVYVCLCVCVLARRPGTWCQSTAWHVECGHNKALPTANCVRDNANWAKGLWVSGWLASLGVRPRPLDYTIRTTTTTTCQIEITPQKPHYAGALSL